MSKENLLEELKLKLSITWNDDDTNKRLISIIDDTELILNHKLGAKIDYSKSGIEHNLFLNYCMYSFNNCTNDFDRNYKSEIYSIRRVYEVQYYKEQVGNNENT